MNSYPKFEIHNYKKYAYGKVIWCTSSTIIMYIAEKITTMHIVKMEIMLLYIQDTRYKKTYTL